MILGLVAGVLFHCNRSLMPTKTQKVHLIERPEKTDHQVNGDPVRPNLLFAQQISNLCCFTARDQ